MEEKKSLWKKIKENIGAIIAAIVTLLLAIVGIRKSSSEKQAKKDEELAIKIEDEIKEIEKEKEKIKEEIKESHEIIEKAEEAVKTSEETHDDVVSRISKNESILEKYKR